MKKKIIIPVTYSLFVFIACVLTSAFYNRNLPTLLGGKVFLYKFIRGFDWFLFILPAILLNSVTITFSLTWKKFSTNIAKRFSSVMVENLKELLIFCLIVVFILSFSQECFIPFTKLKLSNLANEYSEINYYYNSAKNIYEKYEITDDEIDLKTEDEVLFEKKEYFIALQYCDKCLKIDKKNQKALDLKKKINDSLEVINNLKTVRSIFQDDSKQKDEFSYTQYTVRELLKKSEEEAKKESWFNSHYWATLALKGCDELNLNKTRAQELANNAWNKLNSPVQFEGDDKAEIEKKQKLYETKKRGYIAYNSGDYLKSYYIFKSVDNNSREFFEDKDVREFLQLAQKEVENQYFFYDEIDSYKSIRTHKNIYFSLKNLDDSKDIFFIKDLRQIKNSSGLISYLDGLTIVHYDESGNFCYTVKTEYAKMIAQPIEDVFTKDEIKAAQISDKCRYVPLIQLKCLDRNKEGFVYEPEYIFEQTGFSYNIKKNSNSESFFKNYFRTEEVPLQTEKDIGFREKNFMILPMDFNDFVLVSECSQDSDSMPLLSMAKFINNSAKYGFATEVFRENLINRLTYALIIFAFSIICGILGWNFKLEDEEQKFKFLWLIAIPFECFVCFVVYICVLYMCHVLNYMIVGFCGSFALEVAGSIYTALIVISMVVFLSRKS